MRVRNFIIFTNCHYDIACLSTTIKGSWRYSNGNSLKYTSFQIPQKLKFMVTNFRIGLKYVLKDGVH